MYASSYALIHRVAFWDLSEMQMYAKG